MEGTCPVCCKVTNRLVKESCGHFKCRNCLIEEEFGCKECINASPSIKSEKTFLDNSLYAKLPEEEKNFATLQNVPTVVDTIKCCSSRSQIDPNKKITILEDVAIKQSRKNPIINNEPKSSQSQVETNEKVSRTMPAHIIKDKNEGIISYKCLICNKSFKSRSQQYYHLYCNEAYKKPHICTVCFKRFSSSYHLKYHEEIHSNSNRNLTCPECKKIFIRNITLEKHLRTQHQQKNTYKCTKCDAIFKDKYAYNGHCKKHDNIYPFSCQYCEKSFSLKSNFKQHQLVHCGKTPYECSDCKKRFKRKSSYKMHMSRHTEEKRFTCNLCGKVFTDPKSLYRHVKIHDDAAFYKCAFCHIKSKRKDNLSRHIRNMHPDEDPIEGVVQEKYIKNDPPEKNVLEIRKLAELPDSLEKQENKCNAIDAMISSAPIQKCSVIKSVGNVKPSVIIATEVYNNLKVVENCPKEDIINQNLPNKKRKKKYDPCEIYRKILFANEDDSLSNSTEPEEESIVDNKNLETNKSKGGGGEAAIESNTQIMNFGEVHWRKRTSQYFSSINTST